MMRDGQSIPPLNAVVHGIGTARSAPKRKYVERKCKDCGQTFEVRVDHQDDLYAEFCAQCFFANVRLYADGSMELKKEKSTVDTSYKDELQGVTHRGKHRCD